MFNSKQVLYQSAKGAVYRLRDFFFVFNSQSSATPNMSEADWSREVDQKTGKEFFRKI